MKEELTLVEFIIKSITIYKRHFKACMIIVVVFTLLGVAYSLQRGNEYESKINAVSKSLRYTTIKSIVDVFDHHLKLKNYEALANYLQIDVNEVRKLNSTSISYNKQKVLNPQKIQANFQMVFVVNDTSVFEQLPVMLNACFENNNIAQQKVQFDRELAERNIAIIKNSIEEIDSTNNAVNQLMNSESGSGIMTSPDELMANKITLLQYQTQAETSLENAGAIFIINQLDSNKPNRSKLIFILAFMLIGVVLSVFYVFALEIAHRVRQA